MLQGELPETLMLGGTSYISQFYEHGFYDWVIFWVEPIQYPDKNPVVDRYLEPEIDVGTEKSSNDSQYHEGKW